MNSWSRTTTTTGIVPLIDVLLILLVACLPLVAGARLGDVKLALPTADASEPGNTPTQVVEVNAGGVLRYAGTVITADALKSRVPGGAPLSLAVAASATTQTLTSTLVDLQKAGFQDISLLTTKP